MEVPFGPDVFKRLSFSGGAQVRSPSTHFGPARVSEDLGSLFEFSRSESPNPPDSPDCSSKNSSNGSSPEPPKRDFRSGIGRIYKELTESAAVVFAKSEEKVAWFQRDLGKRLDWYESNKLFDRTQTDFLRDKLKENLGQPYLLHFASHVIVTSPLKIIAPFVGPIAFGIGGPEAFVMAWLGLGCTNAAFRTSYTLAKAWPRGEPKGAHQPRVALAIGAIGSFFPIIGDSAFIVEHMLENRSNNELAKFILCDRLVLASSIFGKDRAIATGNWTRDKIFGGDHIEC